MESLRGKTGVVTGAGSGIGLGICRALARSGANVVVADIDAERAVAASDAITAEFGTDALAVPTDVAIPAAVEALADAAYQRFGAVHVLCNNAGVSTVGQVWSSPVSDWDFVLSVNLMGVVHGIRAFVPRMLAGAQVGHVVNTSSMGGLIPVLLKAPYTAAKHAVVGLSKTLREELHAVHAPIGVSVVCPGAVATNMIDAQLRRYANADPLPPAERAVLDSLKATVDGGMSPDEAGQMIVEGVRAGQFWVFPNAGPYLPLLEDEFAEMMRQGATAPAKPKPVPR